MNNIFRTISLPILLEVQNGGKINLDRVLNSHNLAFPSKILISSENLYQRYRHYFNFKIKEIILVRAPVLKELDAVVKKIQKLPKDFLLIGFGGGKIIDSAKYIGSKTGLSYISMPTALSHDGIYSPVAVLFQKNGIRIRIGVTPPLGVIVNLGIIQQSPVETIKSGIGDLLSNLSALSDWKLSEKERGEKIDNFAYSLSYLAYNSIFNVLDEPNLNLKDKVFLRNLAYALIVSGLSMEITGSSRPCSGAEHLISHAIDYLYPQKATFHGIQVAFGTLVAELFRGADIKKMIEIYKKVGLPISVKELGFSKKEIIRAVKVAPQMNKDRFTILNKIQLEDTFIDKKLNYLWR